MMDSAGLLDTLVTFFDDESVQEKLKETARIFYSNGMITVNLIPALFILSLGLLLLAPLLGIPLLPQLSGLLGTGSGTTGSGAYGTPSTGYGYSRSDYDTTVADLQAQISALQDSELELRNQIYYNAAGNPSAAVTSNQIGYSS